MNSVIEVFKSFFVNLWVEHLLYAYFIDKTIDISLEELEEFCMMYDWDAELSLDWILRDDSDDMEGIIARLKDSIQDSSASQSYIMQNSSNSSRLMSMVYQ